MKPPVVIVFARQPVPGRVKTRLIGPLSAEQAAELHRHCVIATWRMLSAVAGGDREFAVTPDDAVASMAKLLGAPGAEIVPQGGGTLGERLERAAARAFQQGRPRVLLMGCDSPTVGAVDIAAALTSLDEHDVVLGPAVDGGYYLLGMRRPAPELFRGIDWGGPQVAEQTRQRAGDTGLTLAESVVRRDLDRYEDLAAILAEWPDPAAHLADLRRYIEELLSARMGGAGRREVLSPDSGAPTPDTRHPTPDTSH